MANEIRFQYQLEVVNSVAYRSPYNAQQQIDQAAAGRGGTAQIIGTTPEAIAVGDIATEGLCELANTDSTNAVVVGPQNGTTSSMEPCLQLNAGESYVVRLFPGVTLMAQGIGGNVVLDVNVFEN